MEPDKEYGYGVDALTGVYLGAALSDSEKDLVAHTMHGAPTKLFQIVRSDTSFQLEVRQATYLPYQYPGPSAV